MASAPVVAPSCATCPSFLKPDEVPSRLRKATGVAMCGRFGRVLDSPQFTDTKQTEKLQRHIAGGCSSHGDPMPSSMVDWKTEVALPDITTIGATPDPSKQALCNSCGMCKNFVRDDAVVSDFGFTTGMCAAKGRLILPNRQVYEARGCDQREAGPVRTSTLGIHLFPEYSEDFGATDVFAAFKQAQENFIDPSQYPTDKPVSPDDEAAGIRAWRKVSDPEDEDRFVHLPIYDISKMDAADAALVPRTGDDEHPELYVDHFGGVYLLAVAWTALDETPAANGEPGTGKTELYRHAAWLMQLPFRRFSITASTELDDLAGKMHYSPERGTFFQYGRLPTAWQKAGVICIDEPNVGPPEVWQFLRPLTDNSKQLVLDQNEGEVISRHDDAYLGMAMNPSWDVKNVGAMQIAEADANRLFHVSVPLPPDPLEREIIQQRVKMDGWELDRSRMDMLMKTAVDIRGLIEEGALQVSWAIRPQIKVARALRWFDPVTAYRRAIADYLDPDSSQVILDAVRANFN